MLKTEKAALSAALSSVSPIIKAGAKIPVLANVLIERDGDRLLARGSNLNMEISSRFDAVVDDSFQPFTCSEQRLSSFVANAPDASIRVEPVYAGDKLASIILRSGRSRLTLPILPAETFPKLDAGKLPHQLSMGTESFARGLNAVSFAADTNEARYYLCGVYLETKPSGLDFTATDGHKVARRLISDIEIDEIPAGAPAVIIPNESISPILKVLGNGEDVVIDLSKEKIRVAVAGVTLISKLIEGNYPDLSRLPVDPEAVPVRFSGKLMSDAIERVMLATPDATIGVKFEFGPERIVLSGRSLDSAGDDEITCEAEGEIVTGFNGTNVRKALEHLDGDDMEMLVAHEAIGSRLRARGDEHNFIVLMPMKPKW